MKYDTKTSWGKGKEINGATGGGLFVVNNNKPDNK